MTSGPRDIDEMTEFAINFLLTGKGDARRLAVALVERDLRANPLEVIFILSSAAVGIEQVLSGPEAQAKALDAWRIASLVGVDLHMMQVLGRSMAACGDLMDYWRTEDGFFLA